MNEGVVQSVGGVMAVLLLTVAVFVVLRLILGQSYSATSRAENPCKACGYELYGIKAERCPECGADTGRDRIRRLKNLRHNWPADPIDVRPPSPDESPVVVLLTDEGTSIELLREHLEARGIVARVVDRPLVGDSGRDAAWGSYRLLVWTDDEERAKEIIGRLWTERVKPDDPD